jgi:hypothetical protein
MIGSESRTANCPPTDVSTVISPPSSPTSLWERDIPGEAQVAACSRLAPELGVAGISPASAQLCLDKLAMRERFLERIGPQATGRFQEVRIEEQLRAFAALAGLPLILKPTNLSASLFISLNHTLDDLLASYRRLVAEVPRYYQQASQGDKKLVIQAKEFMAASNHSIDCWIDAAGRISATPVVDVLTGADVGIDDFHHFARISVAVVDRGVRVLLLHRPPVAQLRREPRAPGRRDRRVHLR